MPVMTTAQVYIDVDVSLDQETPQTVYKPQQFYPDTYGKAPSYHTSASSMLCLP